MSKMKQVHITIMQKLYRADRLGHPDLFEDCHCSELEQENGRLRAVLEKVIRYTNETQTEYVCNQALKEGGGDDC